MKNEKYKDLGNTILVNISGNFQIVCMYKHYKDVPDDEYYKLYLYIRKEDIEIMDIIWDYAGYRLKLPNGVPSKIGISKYIRNLDENGSLDTGKQNYDSLIDYIDIGIDVTENN